MIPNPPTETSKMMKIRNKLNLSKTSLKSLRSKLLAQAGRLIRMKPTQLVSRIWGRILKETVNVISTSVVTKGHVQFAMVPFKN